jgi:hypothetical protein
MPDAQTAPQIQKLDRPRIRQVFGGLLPSILISAVVPFLVYLLASPHLPSLAVFALMAVPPVLYSGYGWVRAHRIDSISLIALMPSPMLCNDPMTHPGETRLYASRWEMRRGDTTCENSCWCYWVRGL